MECQKKFAENGSLKKLIQTVHQGIKDYKGNECDKKVGWTGKLKTHVLTVDRRANDFECKEL